MFWFESDEIKWGARKKPLYKLVNSGSTHNFLSESTTYRLGSVLNPIEGTKSDCGKWLRVPL